MLNLGNTETAWATASDLDRIVNSPLFDASWYARTYGDVRLLDMLPEHHFLFYGGRMGRAAGPQFSIEIYPEIYAKSAAEQVNPLLVYLNG